MIERACTSASPLDYSFPLLYSPERDPSLKRIHFPSKERRKARNNDPGVGNGHLKADSFSDRKSHFLDSRSLLPLLIWIMCILALFLFLVLDSSQTSLKTPWPTLLVGVRTSQMIPFLSSRPILTRVGKDPNSLEGNHPEMKMRQPHIR